MKLSCGFSLSPGPRRFDSIAPCMAVENSHVPPKIPDHTLLRRIGKGAYGEVWLARNIMGAWRAVKLVFRDNFSTDRPYVREFEGIKRFEPFSHANESQIDILHVGHTDDPPCFYYVMELADDQRSGRDIDPAIYEPRTLQSDLKQHRRLSVTECLHVGITLCEALEHLHAHGLIHRDIKPSNIIYVHNRPKLADIGLVAEIDATRSYVGTEGFAPPEGPGTVRADLYSLGKVLYELHTGFDRGQFPELPTMLGEKEDPDLARELNLIILKACATDFNKRHGKAADLREELQLLQSGKSIFRLRQDEKRVVAFRRLSLAAGALAIVTLIAYLAALRANRRADANAKRAAEELWNARLAQARAGRLSHEVGRRQSGLNALAAAAKLRPSLELRNEAIAHLALFDFLPVELRSPGHAVAFTRDITKAALLLEGGVLKIHDLNAPGNAAQWSVPEAKPFNLALSPDGSNAIVRFYGHDPILLDLSTSGKKSVSSNEVFLAFSADGKRYAMGEYSPSSSVVSIRQSGTHLEVARFSVNETPSALFGDDPARLFLVFRRRVEVWDWKAPALLQTVSHEKDITAAAIKSNSVAIGDGSGSVKMINLQTKHERLWQAHSDVVSHLRFHPTLPLLLSASYDGSSTLWHIDSGRAALSASRLTPVEFSRDGQRVGYSSYSDWAWGHIALPTAYQTIELSALAPPAPWHLHFSPDGRWLATYSVFGLIIIRTADWRPMTLPQMSEVNFADFKDNRTLIIGDREKIRTQSFQVGPDGSLEFGPFLAIDTANLSNLEGGQLTLDRRELIVATTFSDMAVIDLDQRSVSAHLPNAIVPREPAMTADHKFIVQGTFHGEGPCVWDLDARRKIHCMENDNSRIVLRPDGKLILSCGTAAYRFYQPGTWQRLREIPTESGHDLPNNAAWSSDSRLLALVEERKKCGIIRFGSQQTCHFYLAGSLFHHRPRPHAGWDETGRRDRYRTSRDLGPDRNAEGAQRAQPRLVAAQGPPGKRSCGGPCFCQQRSARGWQRKTSVNLDLENLARSGTNCCLGWRAYLARRLVRDSARAHDTKVSR